MSQNKQPDFVFIRAVDVRDWGLVSEDTIELETLEDLEELNEGVDDQGYAL